MNVSASAGCGVGWKKVSIQHFFSNHHLKKGLIVITERQKYDPAPADACSNTVSLSSTDRVECADLLLHQHRGSVHSLPRRGLPEAGLPGNQGMHPGSPPLAERKPAAGESERASADRW